ncbi:alpha/beta fold hydrolase [Psychroserpens sp.]|uniref:alpha/beta fold hydrolase n=1 Tax=Psychroserpens sp. TaxID=2020870 RepID=UPI003C77122E
MILQYKNIPLFYTDKGQGQAVVLLHGLLENSSMWDFIIPELDNSHRVICIDLLGHGQSGCLGYMHTMEDMADAVQAVLQHLHIKYYVSIGHSMGGYVALALAKKTPQALKGLCLMNSTYEADDEARKALRKRANTIAQTNYENLVRLSFINLFSEESRSKFKTQIELGLQQALKTPPQGYMAAQRGMMLRPDSFKIMQALHVKKLIILSQKDPVMDIENMIITLKETNIGYEELHNGHMSHIENKSELTYILKRFIE